MMTLQRPTLAPFCWGQAACFRAVSKDCNKCQHNIDCAKKALSNLNEINKEINVSDLIVAARWFLDKRGVSVSKEIDEIGVAKARLAVSTNIRFDASHIDELSDLSIRAKSIAKAIARAGVDMRADAKRGTNSLRAIKFKPDYMADIQDLLNENSVVTRDMIRETVKTGRDLKYSVVNNSCSFAISAMKAMGFIKEIGDGKYVIN